MMPWIKAPTRRILRDRNVRITEGRAARDGEALLELLAMQANDDTGHSERELAASFGWSPGKLRRALETWNKEAEDVGEPALAPLRQTRPNPANHGRTTSESEATQKRITGESPTNHTEVDTTPTLDDARIRRESPANQARITDESEANPTRARFLIDRDRDRDREVDDLTTRASEPALFAETVAPAPPAKRRKTKPAGPADEEVVAACAPAWRAIRGLTGSETPKATDQKAILALWRGVRSDYTEPSAFGEDLLLVATWAHSDDPDARNNIQGLRPNGTRWGPDRSRDVATITRQDRWADRLAKARQSAQAASKAVATATPSFWELDAAARDPARIAAERKRVADQRAREEAEDRAEILRRANVLPLPDRARA